MRLINKILNVAKSLLSVKNPIAKVGATTTTTALVLEIFSDPLEMLLVNQNHILILLIAKYVLYTVSAILLAETIYQIQRKNKSDEEDDKYKEL